MQTHLLIPKLRHKPKAPHLDQEACLGDTYHLEWSIKDSMPFDQTMTFTEAWPDLIPPLEHACRRILATSLAEGVAKGHSETLHFSFENTQQHDYSDSICSDCCNNMSSEPHHSESLGSTALDSALLRHFCILYRRHCSGQGMPDPIAGTYYEWPYLAQHSDTSWNVLYTAYGQALRTFVFNSFGLDCKLTHHAHSLSPILHVFSIGPRPSPVTLRHLEVNLYIACLALQKGFGTITEDELIPEGAIVPMTLRTDLLVMVEYDHEEDLVFPHNIRDTGRHDLYAYPWSELNPHVLPHAAYYSSRLKIVKEREKIPSVEEEEEATKENNASSPYRSSPYLGLAWVYGHLKLDCGQRVLILTTETYWQPSNLMRTIHMAWADTLPGARDLTGILDSYLFPPHLLRTWYDVVHSKA